MEPQKNDCIRIDTEKKFDIHSLPIELRDTSIVDVGKYITDKSLRFSNLGGQESIGLIIEKGELFFKLFTDKSVLTDEELRQIIESARIEPENWTKETDRQAAEIEQYIFSKRGSSLPENKVVEYISRNAMGFEEGNRILPDNVWPLEGLCVLNGKLVGFITPYQAGSAETIDPNDVNITLLQKSNITVDLSNEAQNQIIDDKGTKHYCDLYYEGKLEY